MRAAISFSLLALYTTSAVASGWETYGSIPDVEPTASSTTSSKPKVCKPKSSSAYPIYETASSSVSASVSGYPTSTYSPSASGYPTGTLSPSASAYPTTTVTVTLTGYPTVSVPTGAYPTDSSSETSATSGTESTTATESTSATETTTGTETTSASETTTATTTTITSIPIPTSTTLITEPIPTTTITTTTTPTTTTTTTTTAAPPSETNCSAVGADTCTDPMTNLNANEGVSCANNADCTCVQTTCGQAVCVSNAEFRCAADCDSDSDCGVGEQCIFEISCNPRSASTANGNSCVPVNNMCLNAGSKMFVRAAPRMARGPITKKF